MRNKLLNHWEQGEEIESGEKKKINKMAAGIQLKSQWDLQSEMEHPSSWISWWLLPPGLLKVSVELLRNAGVAVLQPGEVLISSQTDVFFPQHISEFGLLLTLQALTLFFFMDYPRWEL